MASNNALGTFLQDVIGRDEVLTPASGRLREIHAKLTREVNTAKKELHETVQSQWPTLKQQYSTSIDLSDRLQAITGEVQSLESELDGDSSALRPRLQSSFTAHSILATQHRASEAIVELLVTLKSLQDANNVVDVLLAQGRLDEVVPALQACEILFNQEGLDWQRSCQPFIQLKENYDHSRIIARERLEDALDRSIAVSGTVLRLSKSSVHQGREIPLAKVIESLGALLPLQKLFEGIASRITKTFIQPLLSDRRNILKSEREDASTSVVVLHQAGTQSTDSTLESLRILLTGISETVEGSTTQNSGHLLLSLLVPPIQQSLIRETLVSSMPSTADHEALNRFRQTCDTVARFEQVCLLPLVPSLPASLQDWVHKAGIHWSNSIIQRCFADLRRNIATSEYWNKTESVEWLDDPTSENDKKRWNEWLAQVNPVGQQPPDVPYVPVASTSTLPVAASSANAYNVSADTTMTAVEDNEEGSDGWGLDEDDNDESAALDDALQTAGDKPQSWTERQASVSQMMEASPNPDADDAWGFGDEIGAEGPDLDTDGASQSAHLDSHAVVKQMNGHKRNSLSQSSQQSGSQHSKSNKRKEGRTAQTQESDPAEDNDGDGWSFDDEDATQDEVDFVQAPVKAHSYPSPHGHVNPSGHSRNSSIEDAWGWNNDIDPEPANPPASVPVQAPASPGDKAPLSKPARVVVSKRLGGGKSRNAASTDTAVPYTPLIPDNNTASGSGSSRSAQTPMGAVAQAAATPPLPLPVIAEPSTAPRKIQTRLLVSSRSTKVLEASRQLLEAALSVSSSTIGQTGSVDSLKASVRLTKAFGDVYDLYRAMMPVAHSNLISTVPSIGMQFSNDCLYIAREGGKIARGSKPTGAFSKDDQLALKKHFDALRLYGENVLEDQLNIQRVPLMETLDEAEGFTNTDDPRTFNRCERCVKQLVHTLTSLSHAWKPVLLDRVYSESLGILVNAVLLRVLVEIENQEDISEEASHRLNDLCKMMHELEGLFMEGEESTVALHVPVWFKFKFLSELLEASMADIMYLFSEGHLVDFSSTELSKLVRALFADSQLRQRNLDTIARGR